MKSQTAATLAVYFMRVAVVMIGVSLLAVVIRGGSWLTIIWGDGRYYILVGIGTLSLSLGLLSLAIRKQEVCSQDRQKKQEAEFGVVGTKSLDLVSPLRESTDASNIQHTECDTKPTPDTHAPNPSTAEKERSTKWERYPR